jgi:hypothetical protein
MRKPVLIILTITLFSVLLSLVCSTAGTVGYVAAQSWPTLTPSPTHTPQPAATATPSPRSTPTSGPKSAATGDAQVEYYRAVFDVCLYAAREANIPRQKALTGCQEFTRRALKNNWFEKPSKGWEWPLPARSPGSGA